jgi:hypothetical protein
VFIGSAQTKFADGKLTDQPTRDFLASMLVAYKAWIEKLS